MSLIAKTDYFKTNLSSLGGLVITGSDENRTASTVQARNEKGDIVAEEMIGETRAPTCSYVLSASPTLTSYADFGKPFKGSGELSTKYFVVTSIGIDTAAGSPPAITVTGEEVPDGTHVDCVYTLPTQGGISICHHAQNVFNGFTLSGDGCYMTNASYSIECSLTKATKDGTTITHDISDGKITCSLTIQQTSTTKPTVTPSNGWIMTSPLTQSNGDSAYPAWTCSLVKNLAHK